MTRETLARTRALATILILGAVAAGCSDRKRTIVDETRPGTFPGNRVADNFKAADGAAFSPSDSSVEARAMRFWPNSQDRSMLVTWVEDGRLYASYGNGDGDFSPPVGIRGADTSGHTPEAPHQVVWLNTASHADLAVRNRDHDAILLFRQVQDGNPGAGSSDDDTLGLFSAYFDVSCVHQPTMQVQDAVRGEALELRHGFQVVASRVDNDPDAGDSGTGAAPVFDNAGLVSDSFRGSYDDDLMGLLDRGGQLDGASSGDPTHFVYALWSQDLDGNGPVAPRPALKAFPLMTVDAYSFPQDVPAPLGLPAGISDGESAAGEWIAHDGGVLYTFPNVGGLDDNDDLLGSYHFDAGGVSGGALFGRVDDNRDVDAAPLAPAQLYGPDHGLNFLLVAWLESGYADGTHHPDTDLLVATFDAQSGAQLGGTVEADAFHSGTQAAPVSQLASRINRDGTFVAWTYLQNDDNDAVDGLDHDNLGVKVVAYDTARDLSQGNALSGSVELTAEMGAHHEADVAAYELQVELEGGTSKDRHLGVQSDVRTMNLLYQQDSNDGELGDPHTELQAVGFTVDLSSGGAPGLSVRGPSLVVQIDAAWGNALVGPASAAYDAGRDGEVNVVFAAQANNALGEPSDPGAFAELRAFHWDAGSPAVDTSIAEGLISQDGRYDSLQVELSSQIEVVTTPRTILDGNHGGEHASIFFPQNDESEHRGWMHRSFHKPTGQLSELNRVSQDLDDDVVDTATGTLAVGVDGLSVGVFFQQNDHLWFNAWHPFGGWQEMGAQLVDNHYSWLVVESAGDTAVCFDYDGAGVSLDDLPSAVAGWSKQLDEDSQDERLLLRVHR